jgi:hypothetical protein
MSKSEGGSLEREGYAALAHMEAALQLLDSFDLPVEVNAHLDLAISRLRDALALAAAKQPPDAD